MICSYAGHSNIYGINGKGIGTVSSLLLAYNIYRSVYAIH